MKGPLIPASGGTRPLCASADASSVRVVVVPTAMMRRPSSSARLIVAAAASPISYARSRADVVFDLDRHGPAEMP